MALCLLAVCIQCCLAGQAYRPTYADPLLEPWRWRVFPELNGLGAQCVAEADGAIWFGTGEGIWSYDGFEWRLHENEGPGGGVIGITTGVDGGLFTGNRWGISRFSRGQWSRVFPPRDVRFAEIRKLAMAPDGSLWAATSWGALRNQGAQWTLFTTREMATQLRTNQNLPATLIAFPDAVDRKARTNGPATQRHDLSEVRVDAQNRIWLGTEAGEILCCQPVATNGSAPGMSPGDWSLYNELDGVVCGRGAAILPLREGTVWVVYSGGSGHANVFNGTSWKAIRLADVGVADDCANPIQTRDGTVWLSARYKLFAWREGHWRTYEKPASPIPTAQNFLLQTTDGALWIAGPNTEIVRVDYETPRWRTLQDLNFHWESPAGAQWFLHRDGRVVVHDGGDWTSYGVEDGMIDAPVTLLGTRRGEVWVAGSHEHTAATARFAGGKWSRFIHDELSWGVDWHGVMESSDGSLWFPAAVDSSGPPQHKAGILQYRSGEWIHHHQPGRAPRTQTNETPATLLPATQRPQPIGKFVCLGETRDGRIWAGRNILVNHDGQKWSRFVPTASLRFGAIQTLFTSPEKDLWIGSQQFGALRFDGKGWTQYRGADSLGANSVYGFAQTTDGSIWAATDRGISRFDGQVWNGNILPSQMNLPIDGGSLKPSPSGSLWINRFTPEWTLRAWSRSGRTVAPNSGNPERQEFWTVCHRFQGVPPRTTLSAGSDRVAQPGNLSVLWSGIASWREPQESQLRFSFRLDGRMWSPFSSERGHAFFSLPAGAHRLEVRARDQDFNVDPTPEVFDFVVLPPAWRQTWFLVLMVLLAGTIFILGFRVLHEQTRLRKSNQALAAEIEERKRASQALRESEERYRKLIAASPDAIITADLSLRITLTSAKAREMFRLSSPEAAVGQSLLDFVASEDLPQARETLAQLLARKPTPRRDYVLKRMDGTTFDAEANGALIESAEGAALGALVVIRDVTERKRAADSLRKLSCAVEQSPASILITDTAGRIEYVNSRLVEVTGYSAAELLGRNPRMLKSNDTSAEQYRQLWETIKAGKPWRGELHNRKKNGELVWDLVSISPILNEAGQVTHFVAVEEDITERKRLEEQLRQMQKMEAIGQLAGGVAHDFNNILAAMSMQVELTEMIEDLPGEARVGLRQIGESVGRAANLTRQLLLFGRKQVMQMRDVDLNETVGGLARMLQRIIGEDIRLELQLHPSPLITHADPGMLDQILLNLAVNARDAMPKGGRLQVQTTAFTADADFARLRPSVLPGRYVCLSVADEGVGIPQEILPKIFEPFFTTKEVGKGTGLGLATVFGIVEQHKGFLNVESEPGRGACFQVFLPARDLDPEMVAQAAQARPLGGTETLLVVEDEPMVRLLTRKVLERHGYRVMEAASGVEALQVWEQQHEQIALLLTDLVMPGGVNGQQLAQRLLEAKPRLKVVFVSGYSAEIGGQELRLQAGQRFLQKPFSPGQILEAVRQCLDETIRT